MWKICRKTIFPRWHTRKQNPADKNDLKRGLVQSTEPHTSADDGRKCDSEGHGKQHTNRHNHAFWEDPQYQFSINPTWLETIGLVGTAFVVGLNAQHRHLKQLYSNDGRPYVCDGQKACRRICTDIASLFSNFTWAMPRAFRCYALPQETSPSESVSKDTDSSDSKNSANVESIENSLKEMRHLSNEYTAEKYHNMGLKLLKTNTFQAFKLFQSAAQLGHAKALFNLGLCYETGKGTKVDLKKAGECYIQAALKGHHYALYNIGVYHMKGIGGIPKNEKVGLQFFRRAAGQGVSEAQVYLGLHYLEEEKWCDAFSMFNDAVKQDNIEGKYYLGMCYENGWGVAQDEKMAVEMYIGAALRGHDDAVFNLGQYYENGRGGLAKNYQLAMALYQVIADKGHLDATNALNILQNKSYNYNCLKPNVLGENRFPSHEFSYDERMMKSSKAVLRESASSPELRNCDAFFFPDSTRFEPSRHLDVVVPLSEKCGFDKPLLCSNLHQSVLPTFSLMNWNSTSSVLATGT